MAGSSASYPHFRLNLEQQRKRAKELLAQARRGDGRAEFPGAVRFLGLGQLPPEALRLIWQTRVPAGEAELALGLEAWRALASPDPRALGALARAGTPALPLLAPALRRHLSELPDAHTGLSFTERAALELLAQEPRSLEALCRELTEHFDPLPGQGDLQVRDRVLAMERCRLPLVIRRPGRRPSTGRGAPWSDLLAVTETGRAVLLGQFDYLSLAPPRRWVGGVEVGVGQDWRWRGQDARVVLRRSRPLCRLSRGARATRARGTYRASGTGRRRGS